MDKLTLSEHFRLFLSERSAISVGRLAKELNIDRINLRKIAIGYRNIQQHRRGDFGRMMEKYGYREHL